ncbi:2-desacetyl-2-hydroxyethyl bacteriochlorophyllide A dehydrogenase [Thermanaeromonas toyohensis ToBE]|uniref:2-desacetyl-2-hydroxyethyl bacteriochlorophyllide A dehydrogenase n=1 Tax=Thermanaeromonas toyohensis ToBE TaxID=698762 RepID=A0A1W1W053_9FIRM|nr:alcohol dehydrogenase catalytic domain-containing protein [Thermanaeromonas toyohensis]SMB98978.1 2-desacetyl-2-hydroxyethyl bacteriochlorophyllide A dehydrogenase [Thermanaeromonas toyohensis ToBE]
MKAVVYEGPRRLEVKDVPVPQPGPGEALLKVFYGGLCGTDMHIYHGVHPRAKPPLIMGHEFCGQIVALNGEAAGVKVGDKVVVEPLLSCGKCAACLSGYYHVCANLGLLGIDRDGGFAEYALVPISRVHRLPQDMPMLEAALVEPVAVAIHAVRMSRLKIGDIVAILGAGPIGTLVAETCRASGAEVIITEVAPERLERARARGFLALNALAQDVEAEVRAVTCGKGVDVVFDAAGVPATAELSTRIVKVRGQVVVVGVFNEPPPVDYRTVSFRELDIIGVRVYNFEDYQIAADMIYKRKIKVDGIVTHIFKLEEAERACEIMERGEGMKILFRLD